MQQTLAFAGATAGAGVTTGGATDAVVVVSGAFVATLVVETSIDGGTTYLAHPVRAADTHAASIAAAGRFYVNDLPASGCMLRVRCSAFTSGAPAVVVTL